MIFEPLHESNLRGEFYGAMCHWHLRRDGQVTIREIIVEQSLQGKGIGKAAIDRLTEVPGAISLFANCPADLPSNKFYAALGFELESRKPTKNGRAMNQWRLWLTRRIV
jgi:GNAT superfamily N-acetyltransferase